MPRSRLVALALGACFIGRLHIFIGSWLINLGRTPLSKPGPISGVYQFVMWFSGLRGGVAFALASVSYANADFPQKCGGFDPAEASARGLECKINDGTAIMQTTIMIAAFTSAPAIAVPPRCYRCAAAMRARGDTHPPTSCFHVVTSPSPLPRVCPHQSSSLVARSPTWPWRAVFSRTDRHRACATRRRPLGSPRRTTYGRKSTMPSRRT